MSVCAAMIHTVPALREPLHDKAAGLLPGLHLDHRVDQDLLRRAGEGASAEELELRLRAHVDDLVEHGAQAVLVTCSSVGGTADTIGASAPVPVLRIDRPMAARAVTIGERIGLFATLPSTLEPTRVLVVAEAAASGRAVDLRSVLVDGAPDARARGLQDEHDALIRDALTSAAPDLDVIVLAQASMAEAIGGHDEVDGVPVLSSPDSGVGAFASVLAANRVAALSCRAVDGRSAIPTSGEYRDLFGTSPMAGESE